jgi:hypothetical protein
MEKFLDWLAVSPLADAAKVAVAAVLGYAVANANDFSPVVAIMVTTAFPVLINALNKNDIRFGLMDKEFFEDGK